MDFINRTGNSVYIEDVDINIPFNGNEVQNIDIDLVKKSEAFQKLTVLGAFEIVSIPGSRIEKNLVRLQKEFSEKNKDFKTEEEIPMTSSDALEVVIKGHFYEAGGYAKVNRNLALGLAKLGTKVEIKPVTTRRNDLNEMEVRMLAELTRRVGRNSIRIDSIIPSFSDISPRSFYRILYTTIEAETIPQQTVDICNQYDEIWVTSDFCKDVLNKYKIKPNILVFPSTFNIRLYNEDAKPHVFRPALKKFVFLSVFGWSYRKGYDALLKSYLQEFNGNEDVSLLIVSRFQNASERSKVIQKEIAGFIEKYGGKNPAHIARCSRVIPEFEMPRIYKACNAFALPSRGEGLCTLPTAKIRTFDGIKEIQDIKIGDKVYTHRGFLSTVSHIFRRKYFGEMINIKCDGRANQELVLTPNHMVRVVRLSRCSSHVKNAFKHGAYYDKNSDILKCINTKHNSKTKEIYLEWISAGEVQKNDYLFFPYINKETIEINKIFLADILSKDRYNISNGKIYKKIANQFGSGYKCNQILFNTDEIVVNEDLVRFLGYYLAEGCATKTGIILLSFNSEEIEYINDVKNLGKNIFNLDFKICFENNKKVCNLRTDSVVVADILRKLCGVGARNKIIPKFIFGLPIKMKSFLLQTIMRGDGTFGKKGNTNKGYDVQKSSFSTGSIQLVNDMFDLLHEFGILASIKSRFVQNPHSKKEDKREYWSLRITSVSGHNKLMSLIEEKNHIYDYIYKGLKSIAKPEFQLLRINNIKNISYNGDVCNIGVNGDNSYICENIAVHNCMPMAEASLCGLPVIATRHSGHLMFLNDKNSHLVDIDRMEKIQRGRMHVHYWDGEMFPLLETPGFINRFSKAMRDCYENYSDAVAANKILQSDLRKNYSVLSVCERIKNRLEDICKMKKGENV